MQISIDIVLTIFEIIASSATAGAFFYGFKVYTRNKKTEQIRLAEGIFNDLRDLEKERASIVKNKNEQIEVDDWNSRFFNTLEWLSYLVNIKEISFTMVRDFFREFLIMSYDDIYKTNFSEKYIKDDKHLPEFKKLYKRLQNNKKITNRY